jgi:glc operon protein GlcG
MSLTADQVQSLLSAARDAADSDDVAMTFAVVDAGGHLLGLIRMDGAPWATVDAAIGKAWTAAAWRAPSAQQADKMRNLPTFSTALSVATHGSYTPQDGGEPIRVDGEVVAAMGASGSTGEHDAEVVRRAVEKVVG